MTCFAKISSGFKIVWKFISESINVLSINVTSFYLSVSHFEAISNRLNLCLSQNSWSFGYIFFLNCALAFLDGTKCASSSSRNHFLIKVTLLLLILQTKVLLSSAENFILIPVKKKLIQTFFYISRAKTVKERLKSSRQV